MTFLACSRIDYMFADPQEYKAQAAAAVAAHRLALLSSADGPEGNQRYLMCSRAVPAAMIAKIDSAIVP